MDRIYITFDIGTTNNKVSFFNEKGKLIGQESAEIPLKVNVRGEGWMEKDPNMIWESLCKMCKEMIGKADWKKEQIAGIGVTAARQCIVPVDKNGNALRDLIMWGTKATVRQIQYMEEKIGSNRFREITTRVINPVWAASSILYILQEEPEIASKTYKILEIEDFILYKLGADGFYGDHSQSGAIQLYDIFKRDWSEELCSKLQIPMNLLPNLVEAGEIIGTVGQRVSALTGIPEGTPIVTGGGDCQTSAVGCGVVRSGTANVAIGTAGVGSMYMERPVADEKSRYVCTPHSIKNKYVIDNNTLSGGVSYKWFAEQFALTGPQQKKYENLNQKILKVPAGSKNVLFLPHLLGTACPYWDAQAKGVFVGMTLDTGAAEMARAVIEGSCMEINKGFSLIQKQGYPLDEIIACGGACNEHSPWNQIQADVYGIPVKTAENPETTSLGCAMLIAVAAGDYKTLEEAADEMVSYGKIFYPDETNHRKYQELTHIQEDIYYALKERNVYGQLFLRR